MQISRKLGLVATALIVVVFVSYFILNWAEFEPLLHIKPQLLFLVALANLATIFMSGLFTKIILVPFKKIISVPEAFYIALISSVGNFFAPAGTGFGVRAIYLKKKHGLSYSDFMATVAGNYVLILLVSSLIGLFSLVWLRNSLSGQFLVLMVSFLGALILSLILVVLSVKKPPKATYDKGFIARLRHSLLNAIYGWDKISSDKVLMLKLLCTTLANIFIAAIMYWAIIESINISINLPELLLFTVLGILTLFINLTPANIGIKEAIYIFSSSILGLSISEILLIALIDRSVQFSVLFVAWIFTIRLKKTPQSTL